MIRRGFTLVELLVVMGIMGLMATVTVGGYRAMQRGIEERSVMQNVNQFIRSAYQRSMIDRQPVSVYFWNETVREDGPNETLSVVGKAVAIRRHGRLTAVTGNYLVDEFADLRFSSLEFGTEDDDEDYGDSGRSSTANGGMYLYQMENQSNQFRRSLVSRIAREVPLQIFMVSHGVTEEIAPYAYELLDANGVDWKVGDAYGFMLAEIQLPANYIFGSSFSTSVSSPVAGEASFRFSPTQSSGQIQVSALRPGTSGELTANQIDMTDPPTKDMD